MSTKTRFQRTMCAILFCLFSLSQVSGQAVDTLALMNHYKTPWYKKDVMKGVYISVPLIGASFALRPVNQDFRTVSMEANIAKTTQWEDYLQYTPLAACYIMKAAGVKSRSSWGRMLVSHAFAAGSMALMVNGIKYSVKELRPDESAKNSFPSGHTATAFMAATLLHREYGHVSPWITIGAYSVATATGVGRIIHNRHWASDVLCGAGIGIVTGELGYYLGDLIFRDKYRNYFPQHPNFDSMHHPSNLALKVGVSIPMTDYTIVKQVPQSELWEKLGIHFLAGCDVSLDGAYFFSPYFGVGGAFHIMSNNIAIETEIIGDSNEADLLRALIPQKKLSSNCNLTAYNTLVNLHGSYPVSERFRVDAKVGGGYSYSNIVADTYRNSLSENAFLNYVPNRGNPELDALVEDVKAHYDLHTVDPDVDGTEPTHAFVLTSGASFHFTPSRTMDASVYLDWNMMTDTPLLDERKCYNSLNTGLSCAIRF